MINPAKFVCHLTYSCLERNNVPAISISALVLAEDNSFEVHRGGNMDHNSHRTSLELAD